MASDFVVIKDHIRQGRFAQERISLLDWAANAGYDVPCTYRYNDHQEWREGVRKLGGSYLEERTSVDVYPPVFNQLLGKGLHYFAIIDVRSHAARKTN